MLPFRQRLEQAREALLRADFLLLGGGAGLSAAAGLDYGGARFDKYFSDYKERYGISDMYAGMFYPFGSAEERWAHHARHILVNRFEEPASPLYRRLFSLFGGREHFVITTNVESQFEKAGFDAAKIFEVQGNYGFLQCAKGCHDRLYADEGLIREMVSETREFRIPSALIPRCPVCGEEMEIHIRKDTRFVENADWHRMRERYEAFLQRAARGRTVLLELGVGFNTPGIIRFPFEQMTYENENATLIRCNRDAPEGFPETRKRTIAFTENMNEVFPYADTARS